jgi:polysaccharide biosynthesis transport protein
MVSMASATLDNDKAENADQSRALTLRESGALAIPSPTNFGMMFQDGAVDVTGKGLSFTRLLHSFRRRWLVALFVASLAAGLAFFVAWILMPDNYNANAILRYRTTTLNFIGQKSSFTDIGDRAIYRAGLRKSLLSETVLDGVLQSVDPGLNTTIGQLGMFKNVANPKQMIREAVKVAESDADMIEIIMSGTNKNEINAFVNALAEQFISYQNDSEIIQLSKQFKQLQDEYDREYISLKTADEIYQRKLKLSGSREDSTIRAQLELYAQDMGIIRGRISKLQQDRDGLKESIEFAKYNESKLKDAESEESVTRWDHLYGAIPQVAEKMKQVNAYQSLLDQQLATLRNPRDPRINQVRAQLQRADQELERLKKEYRPVVYERIQEQTSKDARPLALMELSLANIDRETEALSKQLLDLREKWTSVDRDVTEISRSRQERDQIQKKVSDLATAKENAELTLKQLRDNPRVTRESTKKSEPTLSNRMSRNAVAVAAAISAFLLGLGLVVMLDHRHHLVNNLDEVSQPGPGMPILGTIPNLSRLKGGSDAASSVLAESIDTVRTLLLQGRNKHTIHTLLITSGSEGEGKTTVATHLAASLARVGKRTLLIDGDLRKPSLNLLFGLPQQAGLCELLRSDAKITETITPVQLEGLYLMQAGNCDHAALANLAKDRAQNLFHELQSEFDYIVIDSGPVLGFADSLLLGGYADAAILTVLRDISKLPDVYEARQQLESVGIPVLGAVVGRVPGAVRALPA